MIYYKKVPSEVRYYFDLSINEIILVTHQIMHELDATPNERFININIEQTKYYPSREKDRKFTLTVLVSEHILTLPEIVGEIKKMPQPLKDK